MISLRIIVHIKDEKNANILLYVLLTDPGWKLKMLLLSENIYLKLYIIHILCENIIEIITFFLSRLKVFRFLQIILENQKTWEWKVNQKRGGALIAIVLDKEANAAIKKKLKRKAENKPNSLSFFACCRVFSSQRLESSTRMQLPVAFVLS